ncbi:MAG: HAD family hydrolase [Bacteroidetes bacterium]|nr:HAD family hydrolase [Bacteroidota bacterium]
MTLKDLNINETWTLFLDRDGVINTRIVDDYVKHWTDFKFCEGALNALKIFNKKFKTILVVTNQQGIGKGLYTKEDLEIIHKNMCYEVNYFGGKIHKVYFSPYLEKENHITRKPSIGMALQAKNDFPEIDFSKSIMVGDSISDIEFGKNAGMKTVFINDKLTEKKVIADFQFNSLFEFASEFERKNA